MKYGVLTVSDRCARGESVDSSGPTVKRIIDGFFPDSRCERDLVSDEIVLIKEVVERWCEQNFAIIFTTGGTGFAPRDVTPEAVGSLIERRADGLTQAVISAGLAKTPFASLSRPVCGIRGRSIIITLPGSPRAVEEILTEIAHTLPHAVKVVQGGTPNHRQVEIEDREATPSYCHNEQTSKNVNVSEHCVVQRPRKSFFPMLEMREAKDTIECVLMQRFKMKTEVGTPQDALGRFCAENLYTNGPFPPFRTSTRDGYAICSTGSVEPRVRREAATAGPKYPEVPVDDNWCVRISTGGVLPPGADAVVMVEDTDLIQAVIYFDLEQRIRIRTMPAPNENIREVGSDFQKNELLVQQGDRINAAAVGLLTMAGVSGVRVIIPPVVGVLSTGNEVSSEFDERIGCVPDSNRPMLISLLRELGIEAVDLGIARDSEREIVQKLSEGRECDVLITTGGVSMGEKDFIKGVLDRCGYEIHFGRVNLKPGKPTTFASREGQVVFGLPGNPASAFVMFNVFVLHALHVLGCASPLREVEATIELPKDHTLDPRPEFLRANLFAEGNRLKVRPLPGQQSSSLFRYHTVNAFISVPSIEAHPAPIESGEIVQVYCLNF